MKKIKILFYILFTLLHSSCNPQDQKNINVTSVSIEDSITQTDTNRIIKSLLETNIKDTIKIVFNTDSFNYYYHRDIEDVKEISIIYKNMDNQSLLDSIKVNFNNQVELECNLLKIGIKRNIPDTYAFF